MIADKQEEPLYLCRAALLVFKTLIWLSHQESEVPDILESYTCSFYNC